MPLESVKSTPETPNELIINIVETSPTAFIKLDGSLNLHTSDQLLKILEPITNVGNTQHYIFDLTHLKYISSSGAGVFIDLWEKIKPSGGKICFINIRNEVRRVFDLIGFMKFFGDVNSLKEAISYTKGSTSEE